MTVLQQKQLDMRLRQLKLTPVEKYAIGRGYAKLLLRQCDLLAKDMRGELSKAERREMRENGRVVELRGRVYGR